MPAKGLRLRCHLLTLIAVGIFVPAGVNAQSSVTLTATVSETVSLSVLPNSIDAEVMSIGGNTVRVTLSGPVSPVFVCLCSFVQIAVSAFRVWSNRQRPSWLNSP